jgi:hypothetical protein
MCPGRATWVSFGCPRGEVVGREARWAADHRIRILNMGRASYPSQGKALSFNIQLQTIPRFSL